MPKEIVILGPPGTGKTTSAVDTTKGWIKNGASVNEVAYLAFTKAAAREAAERILDDDFKKDHGDRLPYCRTLHSLAYMGLRKEKPEVKLLTTADMKGFAKWSSMNGQYTVSEWEDLSDVYRKLQERSGDNRKDQWDDCLRAYMLSRISAKTVDDLKASKERMSDFAAEALDRIEPTRYKSFVEKYESFKDTNGKVDFTDMLEYALTSMEPLEDVKFAIVDEAQDLSPLLHSICSRLFSPAKEVWYAGDDDQCLPGDEKVLTNTGYRPIKDIQVGDVVIAGEDQGSVRERQVVARSETPFNGDILRITTESGRTFRCTPDHNVFCLWDMEGRWIVYLMKQKEFYRIGISKIGTRRMALERGVDGMMPIAAFNTEHDARVCESVFSLKYGIPTCLFPHTTFRKTVLPADVRRRIYEGCDSKDGANRLLKALGKSWEPLYKKGVHRGKSSRKMINLYPLKIGASSHRTPPMLTYECAGSRLACKKMRLRKNFVDLRNAYDWLKKNPLEGTIFERWSFIPNRNCYRIKASNLLPGISKLPCLVDGKIKPEKIVSIERAPYSGFVYDLEVDGTHNFIVGDVVVSNCIFRFSAADASMFINKARTSTRLFLRDTHRFGQGIVEFSKKIINRVSDRVMKEVIGLPGAEHEIAYTGNFQPRPEGDTLLLHRHVAGCQGLGEAYIAAGIPFRNERGKDPLGSYARIMAFKALIDLADGKEIPMGGVQRLVDDLMPMKMPEAVNELNEYERGDVPKPGTKLIIHGAKKKLQSMEQHDNVNLFNLQQMKILTEEGTQVIRQKFFNVFKHSDDLEFYNRVTENGYDLEGDCPIITTIHGSKGRQKGRVVLFSEMGMRCMQDVDTEHRLAYVGATRTKRYLEICDESTLPWSKVTHYNYPNEKSNMTQSDTDEE